MTVGANGNGRVIAPAEPLVVVQVEDAIDPRLAGRAGASYQSPPQPRERAMALVWLLLGCASELRSGEERWIAPIPGGRRTVTVTEDPAT